MKKLFFLLSIITMMLFAGGCSYESIPDAPSGLNVSENSEGILLTWNSVPTATGYRIYKSNDPSGYYNIIGETNNTYFQDKSPLEGSNCYKLKAVNSAGESGFSPLYNYGYYNINSDNSDNSDNLSNPSNFKAWQDSTIIHLSWNKVKSAEYYLVGYSWDNVDYYELSNTYETYCDADMSSVNLTQRTTVYFAVRAFNDEVSSATSYTSIVYNPNGNDNGSNGGGDDDSNGGNDNGGGNNNNGGNDNGGGGNGGNGGVTPPAAPTNVSAQNYGNTTIPDVRITWSASQGATSYTVYRSTSANGSYSKINTTSYTYISDFNVTVGNTYYYKVKASNSAGSSNYSSYAVFEFKDTRKPGPVSYGNCSVSGTQMTLRWSLPSTASYGKPTKALLKVKNPDNDNWAILQELSGTATSVTFTYTPWICTETHTDGYVYVGIILENEYGTGVGSTRIYDTNTKKWIN